MRPFRLLPLLLLPLALACTGNNAGSGQTAVNVTLQGQYQDVDPVSGAVSMRPTRFAYAEVVDFGTGSTLVSGNLGADGVASATLATGTHFYVRLYAAVDVLNASGSSLFRGSVKNAPLPTSYTTTAAFDAIPDVTVTSSDAFADQSGTLTLTAIQDSQRRAAAFNVADQLVTYALGVSAATSSTVLPNLHVFFTNTTKFTDLPVVAVGTGNAVLQKNGRSVFTMQAAGDNSGLASSNDDLYEDGVLLQAFAHQLFAPYSGPTNPNPAASIVRNDTDNGYNDRGVQSESTLAFQDGFCDFLSSAFRRINGDANPHLFRDAYVDGGGTPRVEAFDLTRHDQFTRVSGEGEFYRGSVAISLYGIWSQVLGPSATNLQALWLATQATDPGFNDAYLDAPLGSYPTYLVGLRNLLGLSGPAWSASLTQLSLEDVPNPDALFFGGTALWLTESLPISASGSFPTYASGIAFDRNQAQSFRFVHGGGPLTLTLSTSSPGLVLDLLASSTFHDLAVAASGTSGRLNYGNLPAGTYVARVRVDPYRTYTNGTAGWSLSVN